MLFINYFMGILLLCAECIIAKHYEFIPALCEKYPGVEAKIGGPLSICSFPPDYAKPDNEDVDAVIKHIQGLNL